MTKSLAAPSSKFLTPYLTYCETLTDANSLYSEFLAHVAVGIACGRGMGIGWAGSVLYPLLWGVLVGPPSSRKSTALSVLRRIVKFAFEERVMPETFTPEGMMKELEGEAVQILILSEMLGLLGLLRRDYMAGATGFLMELHDCPPSISRRKASDSKRVEIREPGLAIAGAMTPAGFRKMARAEDFETGFLSRFIYVVGRRPKVEKAFPPGPDAQAEAKLAQGLVDLRDAAVRWQGKGVGLSAEARAIYAPWSKAHTTWVDDLSDSFQSTGVKASVMPLRLAVTYSLDAGQMSKEVPGWAMQAGCDLTDKVKHGIESMIPDLCATPSAKMARTVLRVLQKRGGRASRKTLLQFTPMASWELTGCLATLQDAGLVRKLPMTPHGKGEFWEAVPEEEGGAADLVRGDAHRNGSGDGVEPALDSAERKE